MKKKFLSIVTFALVACAGADQSIDDEFDSDQIDLDNSALDERSEPVEIGQVKLPVGIKNGPTYAYGVTTTGVHDQLRCTNGQNVTCSVPQTKAPTYFLASSMNTSEKNNARAAFAYLDGKLNTWTFTETTDSASATITVNRVDNFCTGFDIQGLVCVNLSGQGNALSEPTSIPNTYTEHNKGIIHIDRSKINFSTTDPQDRIFRLYHGLIVAIASWMGHGSKALSTPTPIRRAILAPQDIINDLSAGEICAMNGFLPKAQFGSATSIGIIATCASD